MVIEKLQAENKNLRQQEQEYDKLQADVRDLEVQLEVIRKEKERTAQAVRERELSASQNVGSLQTDSRVLQSSLDLKERDLQEVRKHIAAYKESANEKNLEIERLRREHAHYESENASLVRQKQNAESALASAEDSKQAAASKLESLRDFNDRLIKRQSEAESTLHKTEQEIVRLSLAIKTAEREYALAKNEVESAQKDLAVTRESRKYNEAEVAKQLAFNNQLQDEKASLAQRTNDLKLQLNVANQEFNRTLALLDAKERELRNARAGVGVSESTSFATTEELRQAQQENETLMKLLSKYREDVDFQKKLREEEALKKIQLSAEKKRLERDAVTKSIEARSAKRELELVQNKHEQIIEEKGRLADELNALKEHAVVLEKQNVTVSIHVSVVVAQGA